MNYRIHYPAQAVQLGAYCVSAASGTDIHGLQSVSSTTSFNLESVFEIGQLDIYENIEGLPEIEFTLEKALDGYPLMYHLATPTAANDSLIARSALRTDLFLHIYSDILESASGLPVTSVYCSGMYINSITYRLPVEGNATESISLVGNDKSWSAGAVTGAFDNTDSPLWASGVLRRQDILMGTGQSRWPSAIRGIGTSGYNIATNDQYGAHIQDVNISVNLGRNNINELGRRRPYYRYAQFPVQVETTINVTLAPQDGDTSADGVNANAESENNITDETIKIILGDGTVFDLGTKNKLASVTYGGGDTGGGNVVATYTYRNFNYLTVDHPQDPANP